MVAVTRRAVQGTQAHIEALLHERQGGGAINSAYIERPNATFRARITALVRRGRALARKVSTLHPAMHLVGTVTTSVLVTGACASGLPAPWPTEVAAQNACYRRQHHRSPVDRRRTAVVPAASAALEAAQAARAPFKCRESTYCSMGHLTTAKCGATSLILGVEKT